MIFKKLFSSKGNSNGGTIHGNNNSNGGGIANNSNTRPRGATFNGLPTTQNGSESSPLASSISLHPNNNNNNNNNSSSNNSSNNSKSNNNTLRGSKKGIKDKDKDKDSGNNNNNISNNITNNRNTVIFKSLEYVKGSGTYYANYMDLYDIPPQIFVGGEAQADSILSTNPELRSLVLDFNKISEIPQCITLLYNLKHLSLAANQIKEVPEYLSELKQLEALELGINSFTQFPINICKINSLKSLHLETNNISKLPSEFKSLENLKVLTLLDNNFKEIPDELPSNIEKLNFGCNEISNTFSQSLVNMSQSLTYLNFSENKIETIDQSWSNLVNLQTLMLDCNLIKQIPGDVIKNWKQLVTLNIPHNFLSDMPAEIILLTNLRIIDLRGNDFEFCKRIPINESSSILFKIDAFIKDKTKLHDLKFNTIKITQERKLRSSINSSKFLSPSSPSSLSLSSSTITTSNNITTTTTTSTTVCNSNNSNNNSIISASITIPSNNKENNELNDKTPIINQDNNNVSPNTSTSSLSSSSVKVSDQQQFDENSQQQDQKSIEEKSSTIPNQNQNQDQKDESNVNNSSSDNLRNNNSNDNNSDGINDSNSKNDDEISNEEIKLSDSIQNNLDLVLGFEKPSIKIEDFSGNEKIDQAQKEKEEEKERIEKERIEKERIERENQEKEIFNHKYQIEQLQLQLRESEREKEMLEEEIMKQKEIEMSIQSQLVFWQSVAPDEIIERLYLGCKECSMNKSWLQDHNVTHILSVANFKPLYPNLFKYKIIDIDDVDEANIYKHFKEMNEFIEDARKSGGVLIHCRAGVSRSATATIAYIMYKNKMKFQEAFDITIKRRSRIYPNRGFVDQLKKYENELFK